MLDRLCIEIYLFGVIMTNVVITLWPSVMSEKVLSDMYKKWVRILRFNFPHFDYWSAEKFLSLIAKVDQDKDDPFLFLLDTQWPSVRLGDFSKELSFFKWEQFHLVVEESVVDISKKFLFCDYSFLLDDSSIWDIIKIDSGLLNVRVVEKNNDSLLVESLNDANIVWRRHVNLPWIKLRLPAISEKDRKDIQFAAKHNFDFVALSFVSSEQDIFLVRDLLKKDTNKDISIVSKIENASAISDLDDIVKYSDIVMVARGDLWVEMPIQKLPRYQRSIIEMWKKYKKPVVVATEMLESMISRPVPTRAEVSDIFYAVEQGAAYLMLSGETAVGDYPVECVEMMNSIILEVDNK